MQRCVISVYSKFPRCPPNVLQFLAMLYVAETRKKDGSRYPPKTIYLLLSGLLRHMRTHNPACLNFLGTENRDFSKLHTAVDLVWWQQQTTAYQKKN